MKLYLSIIGAAMLIISAVNIFFGIGAWYFVLLAVVWCTLLQFALDGLIAIIINKMPDGWFAIDNPHYRVTEREREMYKRLNVRRWKDKVWELGWLGGFSKRELREPGSLSYLEKFIIECNKGVLTHRLSYPVGFLAMLTLPGIMPLTIALPVAVVNLFLNILPTIVIRHNTPYLLSAYKRIEKKQKLNNATTGGVL